MRNENNEFDRLLRLLSLKRFEKPPAGYFDNFPARVMEKIEKSDNLEEQTSNSLLLNILRIIRTRPVFAGVCALLLVTGIIAVMRPSQTSEIPIRPGISQNNPWELQSLSRQEGETTSFPGLAIGEQSEHSSTNPVTSSSGTPSLFNQLPKLINPTPASYMPRQ